jgi:hypothetical protein
MDGKTAECCDSAMDEKTTECCDSTICVPVLVDRKPMNMERVQAVHGVLVGRKKLNVMTVLYGVLMDRKC